MRKKKKKIYGACKATNGGRGGRIKSKRIAHAKQQTEEEKEEGKVNVWHMQSNKRRKRRKKEK